MCEKKILALALGLLACIGIFSFAQSTTPTGNAVAEIAAAAEKFLGTLDDAQRGKVQFEFNDEQQRKRWSNLPTGAVQRAACAWATSRSRSAKRPWRC